MDTDFKIAEALLHKGTITQAEHDDMRNQSLQDVVKRLSEGGSVGKLPPSQFSDEMRFLTKMKNDNRLSAEEYATVHQALTNNQNAR